MDTKYTNPIKVGIFDEDGNAFTLGNPLPSEITNFPADYALPAAQLASLNQEATQELIRLLLVSLDGKDYSTETTLAALLAAFGAEDFASETTLSAFKTAFDGRDLATETTLELVRLLLVSLDGKFNTLGQKASASSHPVVLSTEQEVILDAIKTAVENLDLDIEDVATESTLAALRTDFNNEDFATETTLAALSAKFNSLGQKNSLNSHPVVLSSEQEIILNAIKTAVENLDGDIDGLATEATLSALRTDFNAEDFASETTLAAFKTAFDVRDLATETTLASIDGKLNTLGQKVMTGSVPVVIASDQSEIDVSDILDGAATYANIVVGTTAVELKVGGSALANRKMITIQVRDNQVFWGYDNSVTTGTGTRAFRNQTITLPVGPNRSVWLIGDAAGRNVRIGELS